jgi:hypothetical protein
MFQPGIKPGPPQWEASALEKSHLTSLLMAIWNIYNLHMIMRQCTCSPLTLFYTRGLGTVVLHVMVPQPYRFSL